MSFLTDIDTKRLNSSLRNVFLALVCLASIPKPEFHEIGVLGALGVIVLGGIALIALAMECYSILFDTFESSSGNYNSQLADLGSLVRALLGATIISLVLRYGALVEGDFFRVAALAASIVSIAFVIFDGGRLITNKLHDMQKGEGHV